MEKDKSANDKTQTEPAKSGNLQSQTKRVLML